MVGSHVIQRGELLFCSTLPVADDDERQLIGQFGLFQKVFDALRIVAVGLATYALHLKRRFKENTGTDRKDNVSNRYEAGDEDRMRNVAKENTRK